MKITKYILGVLVLGLGLGSCDHFEELNTDPTTSTVANPQSLVSTVQLRYSGDREVQWRSLAAYHMPFIQMISDGWTVSRGQVYEQDKSYMEYFWKSSYRNIGDLQDAITESNKEGNEHLVNYAAVARIMKVLVFSQLTDTYGDVPYFEAVKGYDEGILHPKYDNQKDIYTDFFKELKEAVAQFDTEKNLDGDLIYSGNIENWKKFANSLRLRLAMRLINVDNALAKTEAESAVAEGVFQAYTDGAIVMHDNQNVSTSGSPEIRGNGFSQVQNFSEEIIVACETYAGYLRDNNDPRFSMMFGIYGAYTDDASSNLMYKSTTKTSVDVTSQYLKKEGKLVGFPAAKFLWDPMDVGTEAENIFTWATTSVIKNGKEVKIARYFKALQIRRELTLVDMSTIYQSYSEVELWKAEMATYGWNNGGEDAKTCFSNAVNASVTELISVYGANADLAGDVDTYIDAIWASAGAFEVINRQHYVNNFFNGIEGFANWRRSGFPLLKPASHTKTDPKLNGLIPRRLAYPNSEMNYNVDMIKDHLNNGVNFWGAPVWWDGDAKRGVLFNVEG
ncbi:MAG: SusD/RagB family nutrient-binding outer membrane lipoprotein [Ichthyobacteriaceae bacterium]|nr:SusD/RagB family nutrient-binding outer membrane lipoprotein [Ichthyobacteriaceae bacterium]